MGGGFHTFKFVKFLALGWLAMGCLPLPLPLRPWDRKYSLPEINSPLNFLGTFSSLFLELGSVPQEDRGAS